MLRIPCPHCGVRDEPEFVFGGPTHVTRPELSASDAEWTDYLYIRENRVGLHYERWLHAFGCGRWFNALRHTVSDVFLRTYPAGCPRPGLDSGAD